MNTTKIHLPLLTTLTLTLIAPASALAADLDNDGIDDLVVGARRLDVGGQADTGAAATLHGDNQGLFGDQMLIPPTQAGQHAGMSVATGDFDNDGLVDIAIGAPREDYLQPDQGVVYIYINQGDGSYDRSEIDATFFNWVNEPDNHFGRALAVGDFDGDGIDDLAIGSPRATNGFNERTGLIFVAFGSNAGLVGDHSGALNRPDAPNFVGARFGFSLAAGNLANTGGDELIIGAPTYTDGNGDQVGAVQVRSYFGGNQGFNPIDNIYGTPTTCDDNSSVMSWFGWTMATGDFDDDSQLDLAIGAPGYQTPCYAGRVEVRLSNSPDQVLAPADPNARFGYALVAGDLRGSGRDDLAVGAPLATPNGGPSGAGMVWVYDSEIDGFTGAETTLNPTNFAGYNANDQKFGAALSMGHYLDGGLDLAVGAKRAKDSRGIRSGGVFVYENQGGSLQPDGPMLSPWDDLGWDANGGALFGTALAQ